MTTITIDARGGETARVLDQASKALRGALGEASPNPDARYRVAEPRGAFGPAPDLESLAADLIDRYPETFGHLAEFTIRVLWKAKAGAKGGKAVIGKCQKPSKSSLLGHYEKADYVIWLAADYILNAGFTHRQVTAALAHELMHTGKDDDDNPILVGHEFEGFRRELELFGFWDSGLKQVQGAVQARMRLEETGEVGADEDEDGDEWVNDAD